VNFRPSTQYGIAFGSFFWDRDRRTCAVAGHYCGNKSVMQGNGAELFSCSTVKRAVRIVERGVLGDHQRLRNRIDRRISSLAPTTV
jgi:hypothetical protein